MVITTNTSTITPTLVDEGTTTLQQRQALSAVINLWFVIVIDEVANVDSVDAERCKMVELSL